MEKKAKKISPALRACKAEQKTVSLFAVFRNAYVGDSVHRFPFDAVHHLRIHLSRLDRRVSKNLRNRVQVGTVIQQQRRARMPTHVHNLSKSNGK